jgi:hypothetical protein
MPSCSGRKFYNLLPEDIRWYQKDCPHQVDEEKPILLPEGVPELEEKPLQKTLYLQLHICIVFDAITSIDAV